MEKKTALAMMLTLLLTSMLTLAINIQPVKASGTIYIRADGSIDPPTAPISTVDKTTYTFTSSIYDSIAVQKSNIVIDGCGFTLQGIGVGGGNGIDIEGLNNVTVSNMEITGFEYGYGIEVWLSSSNCTIARNNITDNGFGISLDSSNNTMFGNNITNNARGIMLYSSSSNNVSGNTITNNGDGIMAGSSLYNSISGNNITNNGYGIYLGSSSNNNSMFENSITNNAEGICLESSLYNGISGNNITANQGDGICLEISSDNNSVFGNNITDNGVGIYLYESSNSVIYHNNFIDNTQQVSNRSNSINTWDDGYPSGGNYWSDYTGIDQKSGSYQNETGSDGMGDTPYAIDANNTDHYPLMNPWPSGWKLDFTGPTNHPIVAFAVYNGSLYAAADNKLYVKNGSSWNAIDAPTFVTSLETVNVTNQQPAPVEWSGTYGGTDMDYAYDMIQTSDGGYALTGFTWSFGAGIHDFWLVKTDSSGNIQWNQTYGGTSEDIAYALVQTADGGYAIAGHTQSFGAGLLDAWLVKTDASGNMQWNQTYGGVHADRAFDLVQTIDGGYAMAGDTESYGSGIGEYYDFWLVKTDADGNAVWNRTYAGGTHDSAHSLIQTDDGGYALAGNAAYLGAGGTDFWLVRTDADGGMLWNKTYGGAYHDWAEGLIQTNDDGYALTGTYSTGWGEYYFWLVKADSLGNMEWNRTYERTYGANSHALVQTNDGGYALAGEISLLKSGQWDPDFWLIKTDASGNAQWNQTYGGIYGDVARAVVQTDDGNYALAGRSYSQENSYDFWLVKTELHDDYEERLIVGGKGNLYCYDGTSFDLIFSVPTYIKVLGVYNNILYAGTMLDNPPELYYCSGSADNPADWHLDTEFSTVLSFSGAFGSIDSFAVCSDVMYIASGGSVYSFNGTEWGVATSFDDVYAFLDLQVYNGKLYLATRDQAWRKPFYQGGTGFSGRVIEFDGENWTTVLEHDYWVYSLGVYDGKLYAGTANKVLTYDGTSWEASFSATEGAYYALCFENHDDKIYVGMGNGYVFADPALLKAEHETIVVPEFPSTTILAVFMALTMLAAALTRKKRTKRFC